MAREVNSITIDNKEHVKELLKLFHDCSVSFKLVHPAEDPKAYKFVFDRPLGPEISHDINLLADKWYDQAMER